MKQLFLAIGILMTVTMFAQKEVVSAYNANQDRDFRAAATYIEKAVQIVETYKPKQQEKTWRYRGEIYLNIAADTSVYAEYPNALVIAKDSYLKAKELDVKGRYENEILTGLSRVQIQSSNNGLYYYNLGAFDAAGNSFDLAAEVAKNFDIVDTMAVYNAALCYDKAGFNDLAIARYYECAEINHNVPNVYLLISTLYINAGDTDNALATLQKARESHPRDQNLIIEELNIYINSGNFEKAKANLELAAEQDPTNEILWFSLGSVLDELGNSDEAIDAYLQAIAVNPEYFDANFNLGALYFNQAVKDKNAANDMFKLNMTESEGAKMEKLENKAKELFSTAKPYLEKAYELNPKDISCIRSLKDIYARNEADEDKFNEMNNLLNELLK